MAVVGVVTALNEMRKAVQQATAQQLEAGFQFAAVSGSMAAVKAQLDIAAVHRDIRKGEALAGSTGKLAQSENRRRDAAEPVEVAIGNALNKTLSFLTDKLVVPILEVLNTGIELLKKIPGVGELLGESEEEKKNGRPKTKG